MIRSTMLLAVGWFKNFKHVFTHVNIWVHINQNEEHDLLNALHSKEAGRSDILRLHCQCYLVNTSSNRVVRF